MTLRLSINLEDKLNSFSKVDLFKYYNKVVLTKIEDILLRNSLSEGKQYQELLDSWKLNIFNYKWLVEKLTWKETYILKLVHRWWKGFCLNQEQDQEMKEFVKNRDIVWFVSYLKDKSILKEDWTIKWLIPRDWDTYSHQIEQAGLVSEFWRYDLWNNIPWNMNWEILTPDYFLKLQILWLIHDFWEYGKWDELYDDKKLTSRVHEKQCWIELIKSLDLWIKMENRILEIYDIDFDDNHILKPIFLLYEKMSYIFWAIEAYKTIWTENQIMNPLALIHNVLKNQISDMIKASNSWMVSMQKFLKDNAENISSMFEVVFCTWLKNYTDLDNEKFIMARNYWIKYSINMWF